MASEWPIVKLKEVLTENGYIRGPFGSALRRSELEKQGIPVYEQQHAISGTREFRYFIHEERFEQLRRFAVREDDLIISCSGTLGHVSIINPDDPSGIISQALLLLRPNTSLIDPRFLYFFMSSKRGRDSLIGVSTGSVQVNIARRDIIEEIDLPLPPLQEQRAIAHVLGTLDDKIELNRKMNRTLEGIARAIFKSWFVDFDPVRAKAAVRKEHPEWSNEKVSRAACPNLKPEIAELFPDSFVDSELGEIPKGWRVRPIVDTVKVVGGGTPSTKNPLFWKNGTHAFCTPRDMASLESPVLLKTERHITDSGIKRVSSGSLPPGTVLMSSRAPIGYLAISEIPVTVNQGIIAMICDRGLQNYYVLHWARENMDRILANANGSTFQEISKRNFRPITVVCPEEDILEEYVRIVSPLFRRMVSALKENQSLDASRDTLLPKLISGELRIPDVDKVLERAI